MIRGTLVRARQPLPTDRYICHRCGREAHFNPYRHPKPTLCRDCKDIENPTTPTKKEPS